MELGKRACRTAKKVADHLTSLGMDVETGIAHTGVVGLLTGDLPGPTIAIRADMDALPVVEKTGLPYASKKLRQLIWVMKLVLCMHVVMMLMLQF